MNISEFPSYYQAGDHVSLTAQKNYTRFVKWDLVFMTLGSLLSIYNYQTENSKTTIYIISGLFLLIAILLSLVIKNKKYEDIWYRGRALAESCKTLTWRYMTGSELFEIGEPIADVNKKFNDRMKEVYDEFDELIESIDTRILTLPIITQKMAEIRNLPLAERISFYVEHRLKGQMNWYSTKAETNKKEYENWFWIVIISQILSLIAVTFLIKEPMSNWNLVGFFTTISSCCFSWLQVRKYQENKEAYTTATIELNYIVQESTNIKSETIFSKFVSDSENAISREHTLWLAQKRR